MCGTTCTTSKDGGTPTGMCVYYNNVCVCTYVYVCMYVCMYVALLLVFFKLIVYHTFSEYTDHSYFQSAWTTSVCVWCTCMSV